MVTKIEQKIQARWAQLTPAEQLIGGYIIQNLPAIPFETAHSISRRVGVSPMTVGRFLRALGYSGLGEVKDELRAGMEDAPWMEGLREGAIKAVGSRQKGFEAEVKALADVHALVDTPAWAEIASLIAKARRVYVSGFHGGFIGRSFASQLEYIRPGVFYLDGSDGGYLPLLTDGADDDCAVLADTRRYSRPFRVVAEETAARGVPLVIITDPYCPWARDLTPHVLTAATDFGTLWDGYGPLQSLVGLMLDSITRELGDGTARLTQVSELRQKLVGFAGREPAGVRQQARERADVAARQAPAKGRPRAK